METSSKYQQQIPAANTSSKYHAANPIDSQKKCRYNKLSALIQLGGIDMDGLIEADQCIATSSAQSDKGMFELNLRDECNHWNYYHRFGDKQGYVDSKGLIALSSIPWFDIFGRRSNKMRKLKVLTISIILVMSLSLAGISYSVSAHPLAATSPTLGAAGSYSVLAYSTVTNTGPTTVLGDLGVYPGSAVTGFPPGIVGPPGTIHAADANAADAMLANTAAFGALDQPCTTTYPGVQDLTLVSPLGPGVYCADAFILTKSLELTGTAGVWIFKSASTLTTSANSSVTGGDPCNVWWRLGSSVALLGPGTKFIGNILALTSITLQTGATLNGIALAQTGAVNLDSNTITSECLAAAPTAVPTTGPTAVPPTASPTVGPTAGPTARPTVGPTAGPTARPTARPTSPPNILLTATSLPGLPPSGGAPIQNEDFPWSLLIIGGLGAIALLFGVRVYRSTYRPKQ